MPTAGLDPGFREYLFGIVDVSERDLEKLVSELVHHWSETVEEFVRRRHRELQRQGVRTRNIYGRIVAELSTRPFHGRPRTERQVRRMIYG